MCELDYKESWAPNNWCFWTVVLEKTLVSPLDCKEIKSVSPKGNQSWIFIGRTVAEAPIVWPPHVKNWLIGKDPDAGKDWRQEEKGMTEVGTVGWHHRLKGHEFEHAPGVGDGSLACCSSWGRKESNTTEWVNWLIILWANSLKWMNLAVSQSISISLSPIGSAFLEDLDYTTKLSLLAQGKFPIVAVGNLNKVSTYLQQKVPDSWQELWPLGWEDPLEKGKATHSSILAWRIPSTTVHRVANSRTWPSNFHFHV